MTQPRGRREGADRRCTDRRAPRRSYEPLFVATLVNHLAPPEALDHRQAHVYVKPARVGATVRDIKV